MRRLLCCVLLLYFGGGTALPLAVQGARGVPDCCRGDGTHQCHRRVQSSQRPEVKPGVPYCPMRCGLVLLPTVGIVLQHSVATVLATSVSPKSHYSPSFDSRRMKALHERGPPTAHLSLTA